MSFNNADDHIGWPIPTLMYVYRYLAKMDSADDAIDGPPLKRARREDPPPASDGSPFDRLPDEMLELILSNLSTPDKFRVKLVSRRWREVILRSHPHHLDLSKCKRSEDYRNVIDNILPTMPWLHGLRGLHLRDIEAVRESCGQLKTVDVGGSTDTECIERLATGFPLLQEVALPRSTSDAEVEILLDYKPNLRKLVLNNTGVTGTCFNKLPLCLKHLSLYYCIKLDSVCLRHVANCTNLRHLDLSGRRNLKDDDISTALAGCQRLTTLILDYTALTGTCLRQLPRTLQLLSLDHCNKIDSSSLRHVANCANLRQLYLTGGRNWKDDDISTALAGCQRLTTLILSESWVNGACLQKLPRKLEWLALDQCRSLHSSSLLHVAQCANLRRLNVSHVYQLQSAHLAAVLTACSRLEQLDAEQLHCPLEECLPAAGLPALRGLDVSRSRSVTDDVLAVLPDRLPQLQELRMTGRDSMTETGLVNLQRLRQLRRLDLRGLPVTDAVLDKLHLPQLRWLCLGTGSYCLFTPDNVTQLVLSCPSLTELILDPIYNSDLVLIVVDSLSERLPRERAVTLGVGQRVLEIRPGLVASSGVAGRSVGGHRGPLRLAPSPSLRNPWVRA